MCSWWTDNFSSAHSAQSWWVAVALHHMCVTFFYLCWLRVRASTSFCAPMSTTTVLTCVCLQVQAMREAEGEGTIYLSTQWDAHVLLILIHTYVFDCRCRQWGRKREREGERIRWRQGLYCTCSRCVLMHVVRDHFQQLLLFTICVALHFLSCIVHSHTHKWKHNACTCMHASTQTQINTKNMHAHAGLPQHMKGADGMGGKSGECCQCENLIVWLFKSLLESRNSFMFQRMHCSLSQTENCFLSPCLSVQERVIITLHPPPMVW